jgi:hypothetical protein
MAYITLAELKAHMKITSTDDDAVLSRYPNAVTDAINMYCKRWFEPEGGAGGASNHPHYYTPLDIYSGGDLTDYATLWLGCDLAELTSITNGDGTTIANTDVVLLPRHGPKQAIRIKSGVNHQWTYSASPENSIVIRGKWCYSTTVPPSIVEAALEWAKHMYDLRKGAANASGDVVISADGTAFASSRTPGHVRKLMEPFVKRTRS